MTDDVDSSPLSDRPDTSRSTDRTAVHLSLDELADLAADGLDDATAARARTHLDSCARCRAAADELAGVAALLAAVPAVAMPDHVSARIDAALRQEAGARVGEDAAATRTDGPTVGTSAGDPATVASLDAARDRRATGVRVRRAVAAAVGVAAVLGGGLLFGQLVDLPTNGAEDSAAAGSTYSDTDTGESGAAPSAPQERLAGGLATGSGTAYTATNLVPDLQRLIAADDTSRPAPSAAPTPGAQTYADGAGNLSGGVARCLDAVTARARSTSAPLAVDVGTYEGRPAVVVVLPTARVGSAGDIWVVAAGCANDASALDVLTHRPLPSVLSTNSG